MNKLLIQREIGNYAQGGKQYNFLRNSYHTLYKETTPRYIVTRTNIKQGEDFSGNNSTVHVVEYKFHPHCKNGC
jgi:hypothetical protein